MKKFLCTLLAVATTFVILTGCGGNSQYKAKLYFVNNERTELVSEIREITIPKGNSVEESVVKELIAGPKNPEHKATVPKSVKLNGVTVTGDMVIVDFAQAIYVDTEVDMLLLKTAILRSLTEINGIKRVLLTVNGKDFLDSGGEIIGIMSKDDVVYDTVPEVKQQEDLELYFANKDGSKLVKETRRITVNEKETLEMQVVKELLKGPSGNNLSKTIPSETKILSVETKDSVCFVNLSQEFISRHTGGTASEQLTIYSIVNSLTELRGIDKVQFLIEGQKSESFIHMLINEPFERDESIIE